MTIALAFEVEVLREGSPGLTGAGKEKILMRLIQRREGWDPFRQVEDLTKRVNRFLSRSKSDGNGEQRGLRMAQWTPACDICETDSVYRIRAELPSVKKNDVHVSLRDGVLTIRGERRESWRERRAKFHRRELSYGEFVRRFDMPRDVDQSNVDATFKDGILTVVVRKAEHEMQRAQEISVH